MATQEEMKDDGEQFGAAFDEELPAPVEQTEDEAFGLTLPSADTAAAEGDGETDGGEVVVQAGEPAAEVLPEELPVEPPAGEVAAAEAEAAAGEDGMPEMTQSEKSWEGRLRKREEELKQMAAELDARKNTPGDDLATSEEGGETPAEESMEGNADEADEAMRQLSEDFGPEFVKMICAIAAKEATKAAGEQVGELGRTIEDVIDDIKNSRSRRHFKTIFKAHPDFEEVAGADEFKSFVDALPPSEKVEAERVIESGDADDIIDLLTKFKSANGATNSEGPSEDAIADAEGVRSTGLRLPTTPSSGSDDYAGAWDELS